MPRRNARSAPYLPLLTAILLSSALPCAPAWAQSTKARKLYEAGSRAYEKGDWEGAVRDLPSFLATKNDDPEAAPMRVRAASLIAKSYAKLGQDDRRYEALTEVLKQYASSGQKAGSASAQIAAEAKLQLVDRGMAELERLQIKGTSATIVQRIKSGAERVAALERGYRAITHYKCPVWTVAAHARTGDAYAHLAKALFDSESATNTEELLLQKLPTDLQDELQKMPPGERNALLREQVEEVENQFRREVLARVKGVEDRALAEYELCLVFAMKARIKNTYTRRCEQQIDLYSSRKRR